MIVLGFLRSQAFALAIITCAASAYLWPGLYIEWFGVKLMPLAAVGEGGAWGIAALASRLT